MVWATYSCAKAPVQTVACAGLGAELNPAAVDLFIRGLRDVNPWVQPQYEGTLLPIGDLLLVFETYFDLWEQALLREVAPSPKRQAELDAIAELRTKLRIQFAPYDGAWCA